MVKLFWHPTLLVVLSSLIFCAGCKQDSKKGASQQGVASASLEAIKNRSIALLENSDPTSDKEGKGLSEAADGFRKIAKELPSDPLGLQNLSVALMLQAQTVRLKDAAKLATLETEFPDTVAKLQKLIPNSAVPWVLEARFYQDKGDLKKAEELFRTAALKPEATADTFFQLVELLQSADTPPAPEDTRKLLESAIKVAPSNMGLAVHYLNVLATQQDESTYAEQFKRCSDFFAPFLSRTGSALPRLLSGVKTALEAKNWAVVQRSSVGIRNVLLAEIAYLNDMHLLKPHPLEFVRLSFVNAAPASEAQASTVIRFESSSFELAGQVVSAIAAEDIDLDGRADLIVAGSTQVDVFTFPNGSADKLLTIESNFPAQGIALADLDRDFQVRAESLPASALPTSNPPGSAPIPSAGMVDTDLDVVLWGVDGIQLLENALSADNKVRTFVVRKLSEELAGIKDVLSVAVIDLDHDADLDLAISAKSGITLWSNRGDWTFADFTSFSNLPDASKKYDSILAFDADRNVLNDFLVGSEQAGPVMLGNNLHGRYHIRDIAWPAELQGACRSIDAIDVNRDACWDLVTCGEKGVRVVSMKSPGRHSWIPDSVSKVSDRPSKGVLANDLNNDGIMDCISWGPQGCELFNGQKSGQLSKADATAKINQSIKHVVAFDFDNDGDDDLISLSDKGELGLHQNVDGNKNQQISIVLRADEDGSQRPRERCNMHGVGSLIELKSDGVYQSQIVRGTRTRFGLGQVKQADIMRVVWTNGVPNNILNVNNSSTVFDQQHLLGSCPYLYAWNGERFEFVTDCLWAGPIGLQFGPGVLAPTREWEYLKIDGDALRPRDGKYQIQLTEELWEAAYFDTVQLMTIDHPAEIDVYSNEKVGPAELAEFKIYSVRNRLQPMVIDQSGKDWTDVSAVRDRRYTKSWTQGINQGLTEPHWLEIDLNHRDGQAANQSDEKVLFLTGWIFPTCTSLNLAMAENPLRPKQIPPAIQVPDASGNWVTVIPYCGFPGGKTKTIAIDLKGKFLCDDHRVRLVSNMELCWDEVFYSEGERNTVEDSYRIQKLSLQAADLHYRGFSEQKRLPGNAPNYYDYSKITQASVWAPMKGSFTRYGEVTALLQNADDLQVVMGAGDEATLTFSHPEVPVPEGWVREFIIYNVGWDKDADLNTIQGQNVEPLPFRAMKGYPYEPDQQFPNSPAHLDYLRSYQTRHQDAGIFWNQIRDSL